MVVLAGSFRPSHRLYGKRQGLMSGMAPWAHYPVVFFPDMKIKRNTVRTPVCIPCSGPSYRSSVGGPDMEKKEKNLRPRLQLVLAGLEWICGLTSRRSKRLVARKSAPLATLICITPSLSNPHGKSLAASWCIWSHTSQSC
ncbi:hypothetical protein BDV23DRAFT_150169 [Aspergillus alliaceus]|uniref:Uncharacterized protein n=1 Tax=Petromyces alliaceus TaxID=209559 RepID=A0A5N7CGB6_PETAA|nr:hypothetical protein BDV23DRAFT_150169 [Aspergillus alliaceus]